MANADKLKELTDKLYGEGLSKGREEGERILAQAREEALKIVSSAKEEAARTIADAEKEAQSIKAKSLSDVKLSCSQAIETIKSDIENLIVANAVQSPVNAVMNKEDFIREILKSVVERFSLQDTADLEVVLPEALKASMEQYIGAELAAVSGKAVSLQFSGKMKGGFSIAPKGAGWFISMSDDTFAALISEYLRPATRKIIFGQ